MSAWHVAPDGRRFRVYLGKCLCSPCWQARCECGEKLTAHDLDAECAVVCALQALGEPGLLGYHAECRDSAQLPLVAA